MLKVGDRVFIGDLRKYQHLVDNVGVSHAMEELQWMEACIIELNSCNGIPCAYLDITGYSYLWAMDWLKKVGLIDSLLTKEELNRIKKVNNEPI